jgi:hypothetical protein
MQAAALAFPASVSSCGAEDDRLAATSPKMVTCP